MRIGIDARLYGNKHTGIGRYVQNLAVNLAKVDKKDTFILFGSKEIKADFENRPNLEFVELNTRVYSLAEQIINPLVFSRAKLDLLHVPHFNAPLLYRGKLIITIHDLIKHISSGKDTTTLPLYQYKFKHLIYKIVVFINIKRAVSIITPSNYWKNYLTASYRIPPEKIFVTYEAADRKLIPEHPEEAEAKLEQYGLSKPFVVYTGNLYPHKNVELLVSAVKEFNKQHQHHLELAVVCARSVFQEKFKADDTIKPLGFVPDEDLSLIYSQALALVQPSFIEGFGLTGLEAMTASLPVISSDATCLPEIYGDAALYFDPNSVKDLVEKIDWITSDHLLVKNLIDKGKTRVKHFSWYKMAKETLAVYKDAHRLSL